MGKAISGIAALGFLCVAIGVLFLLKAEGIQTHGRNATIYAASGKLLYVCSNGNPKTQICLADADGSNVVQITDADAYHWSPAWNPNGKEFAYMAAHPVTGNGSIAKRNIDGSSPVALTPEGTNDVQPAWSPDGEKIAFSSKAEFGDMGIWVMNADGSNRQLLTTSRGSGSTYPCWSPDGSKLCFTRIKSVRTVIWIMDADGKNARPVDMSEEVSNTHANWSPDGEWLVYECGQEICKVKPDGAQGNQLTATKPAENIQPSWSPDGQRILFASDRAGKQHLYSMKPDGAEVVRIGSSAGPDYDPVLEPGASMPLATPTATPRPLPTPTPVSASSPDISCDPSETVELSPSFRSFLDQFTGLTSTGGIFFPAMSDEQVFQKAGEGLNIIHALRSAVKDTRNTEHQILFLRSLGYDSDTVEEIYSKGTLGGRYFGPDGEKISEEDPLEKRSLGAYQQAVGRRQGGDTVYDTIGKNMNMSSRLLMPSLSCHYADELRRKAREAAATQFNELAEEVSTFPADPLEREVNTLGEELRYAYFSLPETLLLTVGAYVPSIEAGDIAPAIVDPEPTPTPTPKPTPTPTPTNTPTPEPTLTPTSTPIPPQTGGTAIAPTEAVSGNQVLGMLISIGLLTTVEAPYYEAIETFPAASRDLLFVRNLKKGDTGEDVWLLQRCLNFLGYKVAESGPGSPMNETLVFGEKTFEALLGLQKNYPDIPHTGELDMLTRALINNLVQRNTAGNYRERAIDMKWYGLRAQGLNFGVLQYKKVLPASKYGTIGSFGMYKRGVIYASRHGVYEAHGAIVAEYQRMGASAGDLGFPIADESPDPATGRRRSDFEGGYIAWDSVKGKYAAVVRREEEIIPSSPIDTSGLTGNKLSIAKTYNRIGGALESQLKPFASTHEQLQKLVAVALGVWWVESVAEGPFGAPLLNGKPQPTIRIENQWLFHLWIHNPYKDGLITADERDKRLSLLNQYFNYSDEIEGNGWIDQWYCPATCNAYTDPESARSKGWRSANGTQAERYEALNRFIAVTANSDAGYGAISIGGSQVMGFNYRDLGYANPTEMFAAFSQNEFAHVKGFVDYMKKHSTHPACGPYYSHPISYAQTQDMYGLACAYNGAGSSKGPNYQNGYNYAKEVLNIAN